PARCRRLKHSAGVTPADRCDRRSFEGYRQTAVRTKRGNVSPSVRSRCSNEESGESGTVRRRGRKTRSVLVSRSGASGKGKISALSASSFPYVATTRLAGSTEKRVCKNRLEKH